MVLIKKQQTIRVLFLLFFIFYAISPLSHITSVDQLDDFSYVAHKSPVSVKPHIFFLFKFLSIFNDAVEQDNSASTHIFIKKINAVLKSMNVIKRTHLPLLQIVNSHFDFHFPPFYDTNVQQSTTNKYHNFLFIFSGLSPPSM
jgi:hypothetical protein